MRLRLLPRLLVLAAMVAAVSGCAGAGVAGTASSKPRAVISQASGDLRVANSRNGQAIFQASGLAPGRSVTGTVQLSNSGALAGELGLQQLDVQDQPGANGGLLSQAVQLDVSDITGGSSIPVYAGQLAGLGSRALGTIDAGESRTYRFTAWLPDGGEPPSTTGGDNAYAGSGLTVRYSWKATAFGPSDGGSGGGGNGGGTGGSGSGGGGVDGPPVVAFSVSSKNTMKRGWLDVMTTCDRACRATAWAQLPKVKAKKAKKSANGKRKKAKKKKVKPITTAKRTASILAPGKPARIRLKVSRKGMKQLKQTLKKKKRVVLKVSLSVTSASGGTAKAYSKKASVKRPKAKKKKKRRGRR
jgi:spore coat-associated protein N